MAGNNSVPFSPIVYEHAARFIGKSPTEISRDAGLMVAAHIAAWQKYQHSPVTVAVDIYNVEAEAWGAEVGAGGECDAPAIVKHPCDSITDIRNLAPLDPDVDGRLPLIVDAASEVAAKLPETRVSVPICGPYALATSLLGMDKLLMAVVMEPDDTREALMHLAWCQEIYCRKIISAGLDVSIFESGAAPPLLSPQLFDEVVMPPLQEMSAMLRKETGKGMALVLGGNVLPVVDSLRELKPSYLIVPTETDQEKFIQHFSDCEDLLLRVNMAAAIVASGEWDAIIAEARRVLALVKKYPGTSFGTGVLTYSTDPEMILRLGEFVRES